MALVAQLNNLCLESLDYGWVTAIYQTEFLEIGDLPAEYEDAIATLDLTATFTQIINAIDAWLSVDENPNEDKSWTWLSQSVEQKKVLAILAYYIDYGCKDVCIKEYRNNALLASRVYYKLLTIPGYKAYNIYHSQLFALSLECLSFPVAMCEERSNFNTVELTKDVNDVLNKLSQFVIDLNAVVVHLELTPTDMNYEDILNNLIDITGYGIIDKLHVDKVVLSDISNVTYAIISTLINGSSSTPNELAIKMIFKCILPKFIAACLERRVNNEVMSSSYVAYSFVLLGQYGKAALSGFMILLENLCYSLDGLERADVRENRAQLVVGMMSSLADVPYKKFIKWVLQLSTTARVLHRQLAVEVLAKLLDSHLDESALPEQNNESNLNNDAQVPVSDEQEPQQDMDIDKNKTSTDSAPNDLNKEQQEQNIAKDNEGGQANNEQNDVVDAEFEVVDEDKANVLRERKRNVAHAEILRGVYERVNDESGTVRTRAIFILTKCLSSDHQPLINAIKELNGSGPAPRLMAVAARSVCDERAVVRRAGAALVQELLVHATAHPPNPSDLSILVSLCRDASILVRTAAIAALGEMVTVRPSEDLIDAFLNGPMHQVSDPETKVQDQVLGFIQKLLIERIGKFTAPGCDEPLPWMFLAGIMRQKMNRHLQKVCFMLSKSAKCINHRLVDTVSTHLGVVNDERDLQCLLLLTSMARHVEYSDVAFVLDYYYKLTDNEHIRDVRLLTLTLELLGLWSRFVGATERAALRNHLVRRLTAARDDGCRIACVQLAAQLDPDNLTWATELMQLSERRAVQDGDLCEALRAADLSLVAPLPPSDALLTVFLNAISDEPPERESEESPTMWARGLCVAGAARLCVRARAPAEVAAPVFAALLARSSEPQAVRVNALMSLSDICARYTCIVEPLLSSICDCLSTESPALLRRIATRELTRLLLGGFLRLRTPLYYRYCALLADEDHDVREPVEYYVSCGLTTDAIYHHFVECVLYYNHDEKEPIKFDARQLIYDVMLQRMSLVQKLNIQCRLAREVLQHAADLCDEGDADLPPAINAALLDTITLLCGPRMKLPKKPQKSGEVNDIDDLQERVTTNIVSHKMKKTVAEVLVPAVLRLYSRLKPRGGQINTYLVHIANDLLKDYEQEIIELFEDNEELMKHIQLFQETIGLEGTFGNVRNLVTSTAPPEPDTPRAPRRSHAPPARKRALRI